MEKDSALKNRYNNLMQQLQGMIFRMASSDDIDKIWEILQEAIAQRKKQEGEQWQNRYMDSQIVKDDIQKGRGPLLCEYNVQVGYVLTVNKIIVAYAAVIFGIEPVYKDIKGNWLSLGDYVVVRRVATSESYKRKGVDAKLFNQQKNYLQKTKYIVSKWTLNSTTSQCLRFQKNLTIRIAVKYFLMGLQEWHMKNYQLQIKLVQNKNEKL